MMYIHRLQVQNNYYICCCTPSNYNPLDLYNNEKYIHLNMYCIRLCIYSNLDYYDHMKYIRWRHHQNKSHMKYHKRNISFRQCILLNHIMKCMYSKIYVNKIVNHHMLHNYHYPVHYTLDMKYHTESMYMCL